MTAVTPSRPGPIAASRPRRSPRAVPDRACVAAGDQFAILALRCWAGCMSDALIADRLEAMADDLRAARPDALATEDGPR